MNKRFAAFVILLLALAILTINLKYITPAYSETAAETKVDVYKEKRLVKSVVFAIGINEYYVDGKTPGTKMDARPFIKDGRTFVPVRFLGSAL
ncbi:MAG: stalk domain-containing protein, partial [Bacillota bacterium]